MSVIKNYGLRWVRDQVAWRSSLGIEKGLIGKKVGGKRSESVNFADQIGVYVLYEANFSPIYVGKAGFGNATLFGRLNHHRENHLRDRWTHFSWFGFRAVNVTGLLSNHQDAEARTSLSYHEAMGEIEGILIQVLEPKLNKQGPGWRDTAIEYVQQGRPPEADQVSDMAEAVKAMQEQLHLISEHLNAASKKKSL